MDDRTRLMVGGSAVVATSAAVALVVALSNAAALTDAAGSPIGAAAVVVPPATTAAPPSPSASAAVAPILPGDPVQPAPPVVVDTVTVPAPEHVVVSGPADTVASAAEEDVFVAEEDVFVAESVPTGSWDDARAWAQERGWSEAKISAWTARLQVELDRLLTSRGGSDDGESLVGGVPPTASWPEATEKRDRSREDPDLRDR